MSITVNDLLAVTELDSVSCFFINYPRVTRIFIFLTNRQIKLIILIKIINF